LHLIGLSLVRLSLYALSKCPGRKICDFSFVHVLQGPDCTRPW